MRAPLGTSSAVDTLYVLLFCCTFSLLLLWGLRQISFIKSALLETDSSICVGTRVCSTTYSKILSLYKHVYILTSRILYYEQPAITEII